MPGVCRPTMGVARFLPKFFLADLNDLNDLTDLTDLTDLNDLPIRPI